ncbi:MAG: hypothetical protein HC769_13825 [Cyanobacteria bacterium CRU_2_1]|nr:hypothetical protein [Cyanobacteria bacterium RU_5_0]NJR59817.1 hypothetical protein [Cyanobacteria bacterium CRU_2_1]
MRTLDLRQQPMTLEELLQVASQESVLILAKDGSEFVLETANAFEREVAKLGQSEKFLAFLAERSQESGGTSLEAIERRLMQTE